MTQPLILHEYAASGNCYKIRLTASLLGIPLQRKAYDILQGDTRTATFLAQINANGRIPVLQIGERFLPESNAACIWLAHGSALLGENRFDQADVLRWLFWEQYSHEPNVATLRFWLAFVGEERLTQVQQLQVPAKLQAGKDALALMNDHLQCRRWFVAEQLTLADIALFAYTHVAEEGGAFSLADYPHVVRWLAAVRALPNFIAITD